MSHYSLHTFKTIAIADLNVTTCTCTIYVHLISILICPSLTCLSWCWSLFVRHSLWFTFENGDRHWRGYKLTEEMGKKMAWKSTLVLANRIWERQLSMEDGNAGQKVESIELLAIVFWCYPVFLHLSAPQTKHLLKWDENHKKMKLKFWKKKS